MSYDIWMEIDTGGEKPVSVCESSNMTSNVSPMWAKALGFPMADLDGVRGYKTIPDLRRAIADMEDHPDSYKAMNPSNGWGDTESAVKFLREVLSMCVAHPLAYIRISR